jgi:hypothetical protein
MLTSFSSPEEMFASIDRARSEADEHTQDWQTQAAPGMFFFRVVPEYGLVIYGEILDPAKPADTDCSISAEELEEDAEIYRAPHMVHFRFTRSFSTACPDGELGDVHVSTILGFLTPAQFTQARDLGWPCDPIVIQEILHGLGPSTGSTSRP